MDVYGVEADELKPKEENTNKESYIASDVFFGWGRRRNG